MPVPVAVKCITIGVQLLTELRLPDIQSIITLQRNFIVLHMLISYTLRLATSIYFFSHEVSSQLTWEFDRTIIANIE